VSHISATYGPGCDLVHKHNLILVVGGSWMISEATAWLINTNSSGPGWFRAEAQTKLVAAVWTG